MDASFFGGCRGSIVARQRRALALAGAGGTTKSDTGRSTPAALVDELPEAGKGAPAFGAAPPTPPEAPKASREQQRFNRYDRNRDEIISRLEMMGSRTKAFKALDKDANNLLSFEEWAAATSERFAGADGNRDKLLTRKEFAATRPKAAAKPGCRC